MSTATAPRYTTASSIQVLEGLEPVRKRPTMYIGGVDAKGLHHLVWEIVDNCVDEYLNGHADAITVTLHKSGDAITVNDNGRGIPVDMHPKHKKSGLELVLTVLHAGGKFGDSDRLHPLRRPARRRLVGRQRPVEEARRHHPARWLRMAAELTPRHADRPRSKSSAPSAATARAFTSSRTRRSSRPPTSMPTRSRNTWRTCRTSTAA